MLKNLLSLFIAVLLCCCDRSQAIDANTTQALIAAENKLANSAIEQAFAYKKSDVQVSGSGVVVKLLADDNSGARHQKFLVKINAKQTLLFAHNIDLAPRVPLQVNDNISFSGEYVYNPKGGIVHWTHHDPNGLHPAGWVKLNGQTYQ